MDVTHFEHTQTDTPSKPNTRRVKAPKRALSIPTHDGLIMLMDEDSFRTVRIRPEEYEALRATGANV